MDVNYLLHREQVELIRAQAAKSESAAAAHRELAEHYRHKVEDYRRNAIAH